MPANRNDNSRGRDSRNSRNNQNSRNNRNSRNNGRGGGGDKSNDALAALAAIGLIAVLGLAAFFLLRHPADAPRLDLLVGADVTNSVATKDRQKYFGILDETVDGVLPKGSGVSLWSFDVNAHHISDKSPRKAEDLWPDEDKVIAMSQKMPGTYPDVILKEMTTGAEQAQSRHENVALMLLTDGEDTTDQKQKALEKAAEQLASMSNVKALWVAGASTDNGFRSTLERRLGPILGDRLVVSSGGDAQDGLNKFRALIEKK